MVSQTGLYSSICCLCLVGRCSIPMFVSEFVPDQGQHTLPKTSQILVEFCCKKTPHLSVPSGTWWFIPVSKWIITPVISELTLLSPVITRGITYLLSGVNHHPCLIANPDDGISILSLMDVKWLSQQQTTLW